MEHLGFSSKTQLEQHVRKLLNELCPVTLDAWNPYFEFLTHLLDRHPNREEKIGPGIKYFELRKWFGSVQLLVHRIDESIVDVSWITCCKGVSKSAKDNLASAMRRAVKTQILDFRHSQPRVCVDCGKTKGQMHVDHVRPFKELSKEFLHGRNDIPVEFDDDPEYLCASFLPQDFNFMFAWRGFHAHHATLRILCAGCNLGRK